MESTKYPVVLVHGMMVKDFSFWPAFRGITDFLRKQKITVYVSNQDGIGAVATNAQQLKSEILEILQIKENTLKFHNKGIYSKLGVNSRKQLLQYAALLKQQTS